MSSPPSPWLGGPVFSNDTYDHECGDRLLRHVGDLLRENPPEGCIPVRTGGDESSRSLATGGLMLP